MNTLLHSASTFHDLQQLIEQVYGANNKRCFQAVDFALKACRYALIAGKFWLQNKPEGIPELVLWTLSWNFALANRMDIDLHEEVWRRFPGHCPYCGENPHNPSKCKKHDERRIVRLPSCERRVSVDDLQSMFGRIYPNNRIELSLLQLACEAAEVGEAIQVFQSAPSPETHEKVREECVDVVAQAFAVANILEFRLIDLFQEKFSRGCPTCKEATCTCGLTIPVGSPHVRSIGVGT